MSEKPTTVNMDLCDMLDAVELNDTFIKLIVKECKKLNLMPGAAAGEFFYSKRDDLEAYVNSNKNEGITATELKALIAVWIEREDKIADQMVQVRVIKTSAESDKQPKGLKREGKEYSLINFFSQDKGSQEQIAKMLRNKINEFKARIEILRPRLEQTSWPPMSYMLIPSVLKAADDLILDISKFKSPEKERKEALLKEITDLRRGFKRIS